MELSGAREPPARSGHFLRMERSYGPFHRSFELDGPVDDGEITARLERGVLEIRLPKRRPAGTVPVAGREDVAVSEASRRVRGRST